jgi:hypothetical protein
MLLNRVTGQPFEALAVAQDGGGICVSRPGPTDGLSTRQPFARSMHVLETLPTGGNP